MKLKRIIALLLSVVALLGTLTSCGEAKDYCEYAKNRDTTDREIYYAEISVKDFGKITEESEDTE